MRRPPHPRSWTTPAHPSGVTAIESLFAIAIVSIAGGALLTSLATAVRSSREIALITVARGLADQLIAEVDASPVPPGAAPATPASPRKNFTFVDHFHGWTESPPQDRHGRLLGTEGATLSGPQSVRDTALQADSALLSQFRRSIAVEKIVNTGGVWTTTTGSSYCRRVTVQVEFTGDARPRQLAAVSRIMCYVAPAL